MRKHLVQLALQATAFVLVAISPVRADRLTLEKALARARSDAPEVAAAQRRAEAGEMKLRVARGYRLPAIRLEEIWMTTNSPAEAFALQLNQERFSFPAFVSSDPNNPERIDSATTRLQLSVSIYTGGELASRIGQATLAAESAHLTSQWAANNAALAAAEAYIQLAQAREHVALLSRALETVEAHVERARAFAEQGMIVRSELLRAEVERSRIHDFLTEAQGHSRVAEANLSFRLAAPEVSSWQLEPLPEPNDIEEPLESWLKSSQERSDLDAARRLLATGELEIKARRSALKPRIGLVARHDLVDDSPFGSSGDSTAVMAMGTIDIWSGGRHRAAVSAARAEHQAAATEVDRFSDGISLEVRSAYERVASAISRHRTAVAAQEAAAEAERITSDRFAKGVVKMIDLLDAATARREAAMRELVARADAHIARFRLAVAAGRTPEAALEPHSSPPSAAEPATTTPHEAENRS